MRRLLIPLFLASLALPVTAADRPADLQPLADVPPPPGMPAASDADLEPQVTITKRGQDKVEEYRIGGKLYMLKVTPPHGVPYYLVDDTGNGQMTRRNEIGANVQPPMWVIHSF